MFQEDGSGQWLETQNFHESHVKKLILMHLDALIVIDGVLSWREIFLYYGQLWYNKSTNFNQTKKPKWVQYSSSTFYLSSWWNDYIWCLVYNKNLFYLLILLSPHSERKYQKLVWCMLTVGQFKVYAKNWYKNIEF